MSTIWRDTGLACKLLPAAHRVTYTVIANADKPIRLGYKVFGSQRGVVSVVATASTVLHELYLLRLPVFCAVNCYIKPIQL